MTKLLEQRRYRNDPLAISTSVAQGFLEARASNPREQGSNRPSPSVSTDGKGKTAEPIAVAVKAMSGLRGLKVLRIRGAFRVSRNQKYFGALSQR